MTGTIADLIDLHATKRPANTALFAADRPALSYSELNNILSNTRSFLNTHSVGRGDRVALVCRPRGLAILAYLATIGTATAVPVSPDLTDAEFEDLIRTTDIVAVILSKDIITQREIAKRLGVQVFIAQDDGDGPWGRLRLEGGQTSPAKRPGFALPTDVACLHRSSGTTGRPKIVPLTHAILRLRSARDCEVLNLTPEDVTINFRPPHLSGPLNVGLLASISAGGAVVVPHDFDADAFFDDLIQFGVTWYTGGPVYHEAILARAAAHDEAIAASRLRFVRSAGYRLPVSLQHRLETTFQVPCIQKYGSSESGLVSSNPLPPGVRKPGLCGPVLGCEVRILNSDGQDLAQGETGEIAVRGPCVFQGYEDAALTQQVFQDGWFLTGDMGCLDPDGYLSVTGRLNEVINRGGQKIDPVEVEEMFRTHPAIADVICFPRPHPTLGALAALGVVLTKNASFDEAALRQFAETKLSRFKIPETIFAVDTVPRGPTGKPLRTTASQYFGLDHVTASFAPKGQAPDPADVVAQAWCTALNLPHVAEDQNFFQVGGDSLRAMRLSLLIEEATGKPLEEDTLYGPGATLAGLRAYLARQPFSQSTSARRAIAVRPDPNEALPLTSSQRRVWALCQSTPALPLYNCAFGIRVAGKLNLVALNRAVNLIIARHEALRAYFPVQSGSPVQKFRPDLILEVSLTDCSDQSGTTQEDAFTTQARAIAARPYDLENGPLVRADAFVLSQSQTALVFQLHHIITDATTTGLLAKELAQAYTAYCASKEPDLSDITVGFGDFVYWQSEQLTQARTRALLDLWTAELTGADTVLHLPTDIVRKDTPLHKGARLRFRLPTEVAVGLHALAARTGNTVFATTLAAFEILMHRITGQTDFVIGTGVDDRPAQMRDLLAGFFVNTLPVRARIDEACRFEDHLKRVQTTLRHALANRDVPLDLLVSEVRPGRRDSAAPLIQVVFGMMPKDARQRNFDDTTVDLFNFDHDRARFDMTIMLEDTEDGLDGFLEYATDTLSDETARQMIARFETLLSDIISDPTQTVDDLKVLPENERLQLREWSCGAQTPYPADSTVQTEFSNIACRFPTNIAVRQGAQTISYDALDRWSNDIAARLADAGLQSGDVVAITAHRSPAMIAALLASLKAGATYLALDPAIPLERATGMLADSDAKWVLALETATSPAPKGPWQSLKVAAAPSLDTPFTHSIPSGDQKTTACLMFTSGSTGKPKGVCVSHRGILRLVRSADYMALGPDESFLHLSSAGFDASTLEIWGALLNGGTLVQPPPGLPSITDLAALLESGTITTAWLTAGLFHQMVDLVPGCFQNLRQVLAGGDVLSPDHVRRFLEIAPNCKLINGYGPTENTTFSLTCEITAKHLQAESIPIGCPISNSTAYVLDSQKRMVPIGVEGDLFVGGDGVAHGYLNMPEQTAVVFGPDPFATRPNGQMYRTGDRARMRNDGQITFCGRDDQQIKIRGFRVELGEIETVLRRHPTLRDACVVARRDGQHVTGLAAFLVPEPRLTAASPQELRRFLSMHLSDYMVPSEFLAMDVLPLNASGKTDRAALLKIKGHHSELERIAPRTPVEELLATVWQELLEREDIAIDEDFFDLGGHSLLAMKLAFRIEEDIGLKLTEENLYRKATIRAQALALSAQLLIEATPEDASAISYESSEFE